MNKSLTNSCNSFRISNLWGGFALNQVILLSKLISKIKDLFTISLWGIAFNGNPHTSS